MADQTATPLRQLGRGTPLKLREPCHTGHEASPWAPGLAGEAHVNLQDQTRDHPMEEPARYR